MMKHGYDAGNREDVNTNVKGVKLRRLEQAEYLRALLATYEGRSVLWGILDHCGLYRTSYSSEALDMAFKEGERQIGLWLLTEIQSVNPNAFSQMQQEAVKRAEST